MHSVLCINGTPLGLALLHDHTQTLHVGIAERASDEGEKQPGVVEQEGNTAPGRTGEPGHADHAKQQGKPHISEYERPEGKHVGDADGVSRHVSGRNLSRDAHEHRQHDASQQSRYACLQR